MTLKASWLDKILVPDRSEEFAIAVYEDVLYIFGGESELFVSSVLCYDLVCETGLQLMRMVR